MKKTILAAIAALTLLAGPSLASETHWGYSGEAGPIHWSELEAAYEICGKGLNQSPINITDFVEAELEPITFNYTGLVTELVNNGHTVQANYAAGSTISVAGKIFELKQIHFHVPSEHQINGERVPMEGHLVHAATDGTLAVVGVMFVKGEENAGIKKMWNQMPAEVGKKAAMATQVRAEELLPEDRDYYRYNGSLTTPPCSEGVFWFVMKNPVTVTKEQILQFAKVMGGPNNRPLQPVDARPVLQ